MANDYIVNSNNEFGKIALSTAIFESIAELALEDDKNCRVCISLFKHKSINCYVKDGQICLRVDIISKVGQNVNDVCAHALTEINDAIRLMTNYVGIKIDLNIRGFYI